MDRKISKEAKKELIEALRERYGRASKPEKTKILDEFVAVAGCHRKHAVRLLGSDTPGPARLSHGRATCVQRRGAGGADRHLGSCG